MNYCMQRDTPPYNCSYAIWTSVKLSVKTPATGRKHRNDPLNQTMKLFLFSFTLSLFRQPSGKEKEKGVYPLKIKGPFSLLLVD